MRPDKIKIEATNDPVNLTKPFYFPRTFDSSGKGGCCYETESQQPNYSLNPKLLEPPEMSVSPARGSIGLSGLMPVHASAAQPLEHSASGEKTALTTSEKSNTSSTAAAMVTVPDAISITPPTATSNCNARRARVGKSMAREIMMQSHACNANTGIPSNDKMSIVHIKDCAADVDDFHSDKMPHFLTSTPKTNTFNTLIIKKEDVKREIDYDVMIVTDRVVKHNDTDDEQISRNSQSETSPNSTLKRRSDDEEIIIHLDETPNAAATLKRRKILEFNKNPNKKSPPNSYKSLIKPYDAKAYLCKADRINCEPIDYSSKHSKTNQNEINSSEKEVNGDNSTIVSIDDTSSSSVEDTTTDLIKANEFSEKMRNTIDSTKEPAQESEEAHADVSTSSTPKLFIADEFPEELTIDKERFMSCLELTIDQVAKGYFSDNEILADKQQRLKNKLKLSEGRSRSETKRDSAHADEKPGMQTSTESRERSTSSTNSSVSRERASKATAAKLLKAAARDSSPEIERKSKKGAKKRDAKPRTSRKSREKRRTNQSTDDEEVIIDELLVDESLINHNNNNNILIENNNKLSADDWLDSATTSRSSTPHTSSTKQSASKKSKSRAAKFSNKKRHRARTVKEIQEVFIPRRSSAVPRWSNGWRWRGHPFKGKVFLNVSIRG